MENICEWDNCKESGKFKAPLEKDNSKNYRWLCKDHIKLFNRIGIILMAWVKMKLKIF